MTVSSCKAYFTCSLEDVWKIICDNEHYSWRSDIKRIEIIDEQHFIEYSNDGFATNFTITLKDAMHRYEFDIENANMKGHWTGVFTLKDQGVEVEFTEEVEAKKMLMKPFVKAYLKKQQAAYIQDLTKALEKSHEYR